VKGPRSGLRRLNLRWKKITSIFISHTHADHVTGLPGILMLSSQVDRNEPLYIYGPPKIRDFVDAMRRTLDMYINYEIVVREVEGGATIVQAEDYAIRTHTLVHTKPCIAYSWRRTCGRAYFSRTRRPSWVCRAAPCGPSCRAESR